MSSRERKAAAIRQLLETEGESVHENTTHFNDRRYETLSDFEAYEERREEARAIKEDAIERLPTLIERVRERVEANGGTVYLADDAADANDYIEGVCAQRDAETLVKSKSMTSEEIEVNDRLAEAGIDVYETDLGEFVLQVAQESPSHIVGPAIHKSTDEIASLFNDRFDPPEPLETAESLTRFAREYLGERIRNADVGLTGANFVLAESGTIVLVTNEGNARKCAVTPDTHVAVAGVEKLVPSLDDLAPFVDLIAKTATGQDITQYVSLLTPPIETPTLDFPDAPDEPIDPDSADDREFHLVLLDNGRFEMREDEQLRETLYCIRCGACANSCANFQHVGGHAFGGETYSGGIGTGWEAGVSGLDAAAEFNDLCTGCTRCVDACPVKIDIPWINTVVRDRINRGRDPDVFDHLVDGLSPDAEPSGIETAKRLFGNIDTLAQVGSATAPVSNWLLERSLLRAAMDRFFGIDTRRELPTFRRGTLRKWHESRAASDRGTDREVVLYPDVYTNHVDVERGRAAVRVLEALGYSVRLPDLPESGRAPLSQGMVETARERARRTAKRLEPHLDTGRDVVVIEPSDLAMFRREYDRFLSEETADRLADACYGVMEYADRRRESVDPRDRLATGTGHVVYHPHCQGRTIGMDSPVVGLLNELGYTVETTDVECCGMAGSFGYKSEYYELSVEIGESLAETIGGSGIIAASGSSCGRQIAQLCEREVVHPVELADPDR